MTLQCSANYYTKLRKQVQDYMCSINGAQQSAHPATAANVDRVPVQSSTEEIE